MKYRQVLSLMLNSIRSKIKRRLLHALIDGRRGSFQRNQGIQGGPVTGMLISYPTREANGNLMERVWTIDIHVTVAQASTSCENEAY
ncbi:hypothetical protein RvY_05483 [Ramazzottius varieornatus]|uniref:Uncharacterized protein n=1 Tax=Ramazzottius varieornatus TaxID=947166 RepID=A0A1D1V1V0_RAMVA|nr:hypothetical protein RvY_05483 [Ramazzottius varieornatus]